MSEESIYTVREEEVDGVSKWHWIATDDGAWSGPRTDWINEHKPKIHKYVQNYRVVVQAGGCMGMYPRLLSQMFEQVYTFEPDYKNFHCLSLNCNVPNIFKMQAALGACHALIAMDATCVNNCGTHRVKDDTGVIPQLMIDDLALRFCDLIMLDVEGYEQQIIQGAVGTINRFKPVVWAEGGNHIEDLMKELGYVRTDGSAADAIFMPS